MYRKCEKICVLDILDDYPDFINGNVELFIDVENRDEILAFLYRQRKKARRILFSIFKMRYPKDLYGKEEVSVKAKNITAMKFKNKKSKGNERIYCKEYFVNSNRGQKRIVLLTLYVKRETDKKTKKFIENLGGYEYGF